MCLFVFFCSNSTASCFEVQQNLLITLIVKNEMELSVMGWGHTQIKSTASIWQTDVTAEEQHSCEGPTNMTKCWGLGGLACGKLPHMTF